MAAGLAEGVWSLFCLVFVKQISISRCERALYKLEVDDLQNVKVSLVNVATARYATVAMVR